MNFGENIQIAVYANMDGSPVDIADRRSADPGLFDWTPIFGKKPKKTSTRHKMAQNRHIDPRNPVFAFIDLYS